MSYRILDHPEALEDYADQVDYLEAQSDGLGERFIDLAEVSLQEIIDDPSGWVKVPYGKVIRVIAYVHESREPGYWAHRVDDWAE